MTFSSLDFLYAFLPVVLLAYAILPVSSRNITVLCSSIVFYAWTEKVYTVVLIIYILMNWLAGLAIEKTQLCSTDRGRIVAYAVLFNLLGLVVFKYAGFLVNIVSNVYWGAGLQALSDPHIHLPIGISFFAFQGISYVMDVGRGQIKAAQSLLTFGAYKSFFPQLIAGPIVRYKDVATDFNSRQFPTSADIAAGIRRFTIGLAKKVMIANTLALPADVIFGTPAAELTPGMIWFGAACYGLQIYFDFSGYSDMAIGLGRIFGIHILENFKHPYISASIREFWQRWHISLSSWFRDYLYIPLGGSRKGKLRTTLNLWIVFLLCGLWHGAEWSFLAWGAWHGLFLTIEHAVGSIKAAFGKYTRIAGHIYTLLVILLGWILFRADNIEQAANFVAIMFHLKEGGEASLLWLDIANGQVVMAFIIGTIGCTEIGNKIAPYLNIMACNFVTLLLFCFCTIILAGTGFNPFIYFRF